MKRGKKRTLDGLGHQGVRRQAHPGGRPRRRVLIASGTNLPHRTRQRVEKLLWIGLLLKALPILAAAAVLVLVLV